jgi:hypothetical protein
VAGAACWRRPSRKNVKADRLGRAGIENTAEMQTRAQAALPRLVRGFLADPDLSYITT